ncbi:MAG: response regulator [Proteobacteria bacterium]|nr:MAG: response regulator [Pseudomonadota bacterium]
MKELLLVEDDEMFREALGREFEDRGYRVHSFGLIKDLKAFTGQADYAVVDLKLKGESGLDAVSSIKDRYPHCVTIVLTGYGSIATAVQAVKLGAANYISKPASIDDIERALMGQVQLQNEIEGEHQNLYRHEREYIEKVIQDHDGNISLAAKALGIHRQSLQRKLRKYIS